MFLLFLCRKELLLQCLFFFGKKIVILVSTFYFLQWPQFLMTTFIRILHEASFFGNFFSIKVCSQLSLAMRMSVSLCCFFSDDLAPAAVVVLVAVTKLPACLSFCWLSLKVKLLATVLSRIRRCCCMLSVAEHLMLLQSTSCFSFIFIILDFLVLGNFFGVC